MAGILGCSIEEIEGRMTNEEYMCWKIYLAEPRGDRRADYHAALITHSIYEFMLGFSKNKQKLNLEQFILKFEPPKSDRIADTVDKLNRIFGGIIPEEHIPQKDDSHRLDLEHL